MPTSVLAPGLEMHWKIIESYGLDPAVIFKKAAIDPALIKDPNARVPYAKLAVLLKESVALTRDTSMWLRAEDYWHPSQLGALGYAWLASSTLRSGLGRLQRYLKVISSAGHLSYEETANEFQVQFNFEDKDAALFGRDGGAVMLFITLCRANCGKDFNPTAVKLAQPTPVSPGVFFERFRCQVEFDQPTTSVTFNPDILDQPFSTSNPELAQLSDQVMIRYLARHDKKDIKNRVMTEILEQLPSGGITDSTIAEALYMNPRTLQRRLNEADASFKELLNEVRSELADKYIRDSKLTLTEVSFLLGFSEVSSFSRAFKRWKGHSPSAARAS